jgi:hypothetical protein
MSEKSMLFNDDMVRAILDKRKTVTRRIIKPHNTGVAKRNNYQQGDGLWVDPTTDNLDATGHIKDYSVSPCWNRIDYYIKRYAPYKPGDIIYVREAYCPNYFDEGIAGYRGDLRGNRNAYRADYCKNIVGDVVPEPKWRPSIHMPKTAARIWLRITDVRVERLQDITEEQAKAEGANYKNGKNVGLEEKMNRTAIERFAEIWDSTIKKPDIGKYSWEANPWVWVIEFERCDKPKECDD